MRIPLLSLLMLLLLQARAQVPPEELITVDGEIINAEDNSPVPFVHIVNASTSQGTASNSQGRFEISMSPSDTLLFSAIGFEQYTFQLSEEVTTKRIVVTIVLDASSMELEPVKIFAYKDESTFKRAIIEMELPEETPKRMQLKGLGFYYGPRKEVAANGMSPISFIADKVSKRAKERRTYAKVTASYDRWKERTEAYTPQRLQDLTGLPEDQIEDFMKFCKLNEAFMSLSSEYEVVVAIEKCLADYAKEDTLDSIRKN